ncbi:MAG: acetyl-CoA hydrolase/transferase C-terminal domain-containing protein [Salinirussus sp.]
MITERLTGNHPVTDAESLAAGIDAEAVVLVSGFGRVGYPKAVPSALARESRDLDLTVVSGAVVGDEIDTEMVEAGAIARRYPAQTSDAMRAAANDGRVAYSDRHLSRVSLEARTGHFGDPDVAVVEATAVGEDWLVPARSIGHTPAFVDLADDLIIELNDAQPLALQHLYDVYPRPLPPDRQPIPLEDPVGRIGSPRISFDPDALRGIVRTDRPDTPYDFREPSDIHEQIAANLSTFLAAECERNPAIGDRLVIEFGVGSLGNALMGAIGETDLGDRDVVYFGEVFQDGLLSAIDDGTIVGASATSLALSDEGANQLIDDIERYAERIVLRNADVSNAPALIDRFGVVAVNTVLEVDLYGHANATHVNGSRVINGIGGGGDFTTNSPCSILVLGSTADNGRISRIVPAVSHPDYTEHDVDIVITERGVADLRGMAPRERPAALIESCAHPEFRAQLAEYVERAEQQGGHEPHHLSTAFAWQEP